MLARIVAHARGYIQFLNGDQAYGRYLEHFRNAHAQEGLPLTRADFFQRELQRRWDSVRRCC
jgi:uncharacterized short protein YbdD (DUF466 family)